MLERLGERPAAGRLKRAVERVTADPSLHIPDLGGRATTRQVSDAVIAAIRGDDAEGRCRDRARRTFRARGHP